MNDHRNQRHRTSEPAWPTGDESDSRWPRHEEPQERTGFWSPLWDDDDDPTPQRPRPNGRGDGHQPRRVPPPPQQPTMAGRRMVQPGPAGTTVALPVAARPPIGAPPPRPRPRDRSEDPTDLMPPVPDRTRREPDLLTHREPDYDEEFDDLDEDRPPSDEQRRKRRKKIWRRVRRTLYAFTALMIIGPILAFLIAYQLVTVPSPEEVRAGQQQVVKLQYADGSPMGEIVPQDGDRTMVRYEDLAAAPHVLDAVFAAEDGTFMANSGFDLSGVMRAAYNQVTGGSGGGSTITQQYIKQATGADERTLTRKALEVVKAYKMNRTYSKEDIITAYLNTIYLGRNSIGIAAAAKAYYAKDLKSLTPSEAALLAGLIQSPGRYKDVAYMQRRWNYVMDQMVANGWFPAEQRKAEQFPTPVPYEQTKPKAETGPRGLIHEAALDEVERVLGITRADIQRGGYTIVTTIDPQAQTLAEQAVADGMKGLPDNLRPALVAVDPKTGEIKAYYGGADGVGTDWAAAPQEPGSAFKPFDAVALLKTGKGLGEEYDSSVNTFKGRPADKPVRNASRPTCKMCTVSQAMKESLNTVFYNLVVNTLGVNEGPKLVAEAARQAGITTPLDKASEDGNIAIGGGLTQVTTVDMASAYATFAARGIHRDAHIVAKVLNNDGSSYWQAQSKEQPAFDADARTNDMIARNVTEALIPVPTYSRIPCADGRVCAGKTGTHQRADTGDNAKAWMVGYTPQISAAVSLSGKEGEAINDAKGGDIFGAKVPGAIWKKFMDSYHKTFKLPKEDFGRYEAIGKGSSLSEQSTSKKPTSKRNEPTTTTRGRPTDPPEQTTTTRTRPRPTLPTFPTFSNEPDPGESPG